MKYALVTGASRGLGRAIAVRLAQMGYNILINYAGNTAAAEETLRLVREAGTDGELWCFDVADREKATGTSGSGRVHRGMCQQCRYPS